MARRRRRGVRNARRLWRKGAVGHTAKGVAYHIGNSLRGLRWMSRWGKKRADRDVIRTKDGVKVNTHWNRPLAHGFRDPAGKWTRLQRIDQSNYADVRRLVAQPGNFHINTLEADLREAGRLKMSVIVEPKSWVGLDNLEEWRDVKRMAVKYGVPITGYALRGNARCLPFMRAAGIKSKQV